MKFLHLIGTPYEVKDCWGIVIEYYRIELNIVLKDYYSEIPNDPVKARSLIYSSKGDFIKTNKLEKGTIVLIAFKGIECHVAVYIGDGKILHSYAGVGCVVEPLSKWEKLVTGYYRIENDKT